MGSTDGGNGADSLRRRRHGVSMVLVIVAMLSLIWQHKYSGGAELCLSTFSSVVLPHVAGCPHPQHILNILPCFSALFVRVLERTLPNNVLLPLETGGSALNIGQSGRRVTSRVPAQLQGGKAAAPVAQSGPWQRNHLQLHVAVV